MLHRLGSDNCFARSIWFCKPRLRCSRSSVIRLFQCFIYLNIFILFGLTDSACTFLGDHNYSKLFGFVLHCFLKCELFVFMFQTGKQFSIPQCNALELACLCATINQNLSWLIVGYDCQLYAKLHIICTLKIYTMRLCNNVTNKIKLQYVLHCIMHNVSHTILSDAVSNVLVL